MPSSGTGTGTPISPPGPVPPGGTTVCLYPGPGSLALEESAVKLPRYAAILGYRECAFFGVEHPDNRLYDCRTLWTKPQRDMAAKYLAEAQEEIEQVVGYPLSVKWFTDEVYPYRFPLITGRSHAIAAGVRAESDIALGAAVAHAADPAVVTVATTLTAAQLSEAHVYHPGTAIEIWPSCLTLSGGFLTISIPRCRMVKESFADNDENGVDYADTTPAGPFEQTVDVKRVYTDPSTQASLVWPHASGCTGGACCPTCAEYTKAGCMYFKDLDLGIVDVLPGSYSGGAWTADRSCCSKPAYARLNYAAGLSTLPRQAEDAIVRLAHAKMPEEPCGCTAALRLWKRDTHTPEVLTRERINCDFGLSDGAWIAYRFAKAMKLMRGSVL